MNFDNLITAQLVWDGGDETRIPTVFEAPLPNQMQGTTHDKLGEIAARTCYDSFGVDPKTGKPRGRSTEKLHEHLLEVRNYNVYEHADFTVMFSGISHDTLMQCFINRPGVWCERTHEGFEITMNHRCVLEWDRWKTSFSKLCSHTTDRLGAQLWNHAKDLAPHLYPEPKEFDPGDGYIISRIGNLLPTQASISLYLSFSRGAGNEQCRHRFRMSQRSTRFVDESESPYVIHPLITKFLADDAANTSVKQDIISRMKASEREDKSTYNNLVGYLQEYLKSQGVEGTQARKQARGASRGFLGLALHTEMIFTATAAQWLWVLSQRGTALADAEIRVLYSPQVLDCLKSSRYGHFFSHLRVVDSPDGIGQVIV